MQTSMVSSSMASGGSVPVTGARELGQDTFLRLLVTQLRHQDPLKPMDSTEFSAQLAQFASLEQLTKVNTSLGNLLIGQISTANMAATGLLGKTIKAAGDSVNVQGGKSSPISYTLPQDAASVVFQIYDAHGLLVRTLIQGAQAPGDQQMSWNATDDRGRKVPDGTYTVKAVATGTRGEAVGVTLYQTGSVTAVQYEGGVAYLLIGRQKVQMGQVLQVYGSASEARSTSNASL